MVGMVNSETQQIDEEMSIFSVLKMSPSDWQIIINERLALIDWDAKSKTLAQPCGNFLTLSFFVIRLLQDNLIRPKLLKLHTDSDAFDFSKSVKLRSHDYLKEFSYKSGSMSTSKNEYYFLSLRRLAKILDISMIILVTWNVISTFRFLSCFYKSYSLFYLQNSTGSRNLTKHSFTGLNKDALYDNITNGSLWTLFKYLFSSDLENDHIDKDCSEKDFYYQLKKWTPTKFNVYFFISFSPTCLVFLLFSEVSFRTAFAVLIHQYILYFLVANRYEQRIADDFLIASATNTEVEEKFFRPKISKKQQDVQVDATPYGDGYVQFFPSSIKSHIFKSHSLTGNSIIEKYNMETEEFDTIPDGSNDTFNTIVKPPQLHPYILYRNPYDHRYDAYRDGEPSVYYSREGSPTRISTLPGFYSPGVSTASGMSTPYFRHERPSAFVNNLSVNQGVKYNKNSSVYNPSRRNSKSPLRQPIISSKNLESTKTLRANLADDDLKAMRRPNLSLSSRSSSKSPSRNLRRYNDTGNRDIR